MNIVLSHRLAMTGRICYAVALIFFGAQHLVYGEFVTRILPAWPAWIPGRAYCPYLAGVVLMAVGIALGINRMAFRTAFWFGAFVLFSAAVLAVPVAVSHANWGGEWTNAGKAFALGGGAWLVAFTLPAPFIARPAAWPVLIGRLCLSGFLILGGIQHFLWAKYVAQLVPAWIPGAGFWTYFAGVALIAGGVGLLIRPTARLAAGLTALMIFLWLILLHIPRSLANVHDANEGTAVFEALAIAGIALLLATIPDKRPRPNGI
jgi:uncharacterized membrane protein